jgi:hypothetical protein
MLGINVVSRRGIPPPAIHPTIRTNLIHLAETYNQGQPVNLWYDAIEEQRYANISALNIMISEETLLIEPVHFVHVAADIVQAHQRRLGVLRDNFAAINRDVEHQMANLPPMDHITFEEAAAVPFQAILDRLFDAAVEASPPREYAPVPNTVGTFRRWRKKDATAGEIGSMCSICQEDFRSNQKIRVMHEKCTYHEKCISKWFEYKNTCPNCKRGF